MKTIGQKISFYPFTDEEERQREIEDKKSQDDLITQSGLDLCEKLSHMEFWCGDTTLHKRNPDYTNTAECCVTHIVGLPRHPATNEEMPPCSRPRAARGSSRHGVRKISPLVGGRS